MTRNLEVGRRETLIVAPDQSAKLGSCEIISLLGKGRIGGSSLNLCASCVLYAGAGRRRSDLIYFDSQVFQPVQS